ncbi:SDR family oxidoreductase [Agreia sp.]|uniref:SDR family oxidoreductase n=1 Tax=Agreia sp. TaxID=1872416 RepID=UPI0035BC52C4
MTPHPAPEATSTTRTVLITGTSSGLGLATALAFRRAHWNVAATLRVPDNADPALVNDSQVEILALDVTDHRSIEKAVQAARARFGSIDVIVNSAGYSQVGALEEVSLDQLREQFETNVLGAAALIQAVLPEMRQRRSGHIISISSLAGVVAVPGLAAYSMSKFALEGLSEALKGEVAQFGIAVTLVEPGRLQTGIAGSARPPSTPVSDYHDPDGDASLLDQLAISDAEGTANAIVTLVDSPNPPAQLIVGAGTDLVHEKLEARIVSDHRWEETTAATL